jgi:ATP-dependent helicase/nuclease subunit B
MLRIFLGPFHYELENALVEMVTEWKQADSFSPVALVVPSQRLCQRLKTLLVIEKGLPLINTHFLTFHQLALRIWEAERGIPDQLISDELFFEDLIRTTLKSSFSPDNPLHSLAATVGGGAILRATIRDIKDAAIDIPTALEALEEGYIETTDKTTFVSLLQLYSKIAVISEELDLLEPSDLTRFAIQMVPGSKFLSQLDHIIYYGFYDLTQLQLDFFTAIATHYPTTLFFPLQEGHPAFFFAELFFKRYIHGLVSDTKGMVRLSRTNYPKALSNGLNRLFVNNPAEPPPIAPACQVISTSGLEDEVLTVAKEICRLVEEEGYQFNQIGVVGRGLERYGLIINRIFSRHKIPFGSSAEIPISLFPMAKAINFLCLILKEDYYRPHLIELVSSPYFRGKDFCPPGIMPRPDYWDFLSRRLSITKGINEWRRIERFIHSGMDFLEEEDDSIKQDLTLTALEVQGFWKIISELEKDLSSLPARATWSKYIEHLKGIINKYLDLPGFVADTGCDQEEVGIGNELAAILDSLSQRDIFAPLVSLEECISTIQTVLEKATIKLGTENILGVQVLDAMAARGIPFKVLFILGLNEKIFPRYIQEDALLRDAVRRSLEATLGYKIPEKMLGYEEEKLLFYLLLDAASDRVYCLYQRSDQDGRPLVPSWYLNELYQALWGRRMTLELTKPVTEAIPRGWLDKYRTSSYFQEQLLTPKELAQTLLLQNKKVLPFLRKMSLSPELFRHSNHALITLEKARKELTPQDGFTGILTEYWDSMKQKGLAPTSLELYAQCPFRYFARQVLQLISLERPESFVGLEPIEEGELFHQILRLFYPSLNQVHYFQSHTSNEEEIHMLLEQAADKVFQQFQEKRSLRYQLLWEIWQEEAKDILRQLVKKDLSDIYNSGFIPTYFEEEYRVASPCSRLDILRDLSFRGRLDRIDLKRENPFPLFRIIDYKYKTSTYLKREDKNLMEAALRGQRLQPPIYILIASQLLKLHFPNAQSKAEGVIFQFICPKQEDPLAISEFPGDCWSTPLGEHIIKNIALLLQGIREGLFFIIPEDQGYCRYCEYSPICRKNHPPSRWRAQNDPRTKPYFDLRFSKLPKQKRIS